MTPPTPTPPTTVHLGDCLEVLKTLPPDSVDAVITDPPYGLSFLNSGWDHSVPGPEYWKEALRVAKPGAYLAAFGGPRVYHRLTCAIEDAGWEIRDCLSYLYKSGFPKSHESLKPGWEPIILARKKPQGSISANFAIHGTGRLNVDECRIPLPPGDTGWNVPAPDTQVARPAAPANAQQLPGSYRNPNGLRSVPHEGGRWPANVVLDASSIELGSDLGDHARWFSCPKPSPRERGTGNDHPTVKPVAVMAWLCRLLVPANGTVLDPFAGSGTTALAAMEEGFASILIERDPHYVEIIRSRTAQPQKPQTS